MTFANSDESPARVERDPSLPDFLIIGTQKAGTTALMLNLASHPRVYMAGRHGRPGELHFFNAYWRNGEDWYRRHFSRPERLQGEKTPDYLANHQALVRMAALVPHAKLILALRNPVDRAYSAWNHFNKDPNAASKGWERMPFEQAVQRTDGIFRHLLHDGRYADHVRHVLQLYRRERLHVIITERMRANADAVYANLLDFLELPAASKPFTSHFAQSYDEPMKPETRATLAGLFADSNRDLCQLLGLAIPEWT